MKILNSSLLKFSFIALFIGGGPGVFADSFVENSKRNPPKKQSETDKFKPKNPKRDFHENHDFLVYGGNWTYVPSGSVIHTPQLLEERVTKTKTGKFLPWDEFYRKNHLWIALEELQPDHIAGKKDFSESFKKRLSSSKRITIACFKKRPISIIKFKEQDNED